MSATVQEARQLAHRLGHFDIIFQRLHMVPHPQKLYYGRCPKCGKCCDAWEVPPVSYPFENINGPAVRELCD